MKIILSLKNWADNIYGKYPRITGYAGRLVFSAVCFFLIRYNCGYNTLFTSIWFVAVLSVFCAFAPVRLLVFIVMIYLTVQICSLSLGVGAAFAAVLFIIYLIFFRFDSAQLYIIFLIPVFSMARIPLLIPLVLAATAPFETVIVVMFGNLIYYMIRYINANAAVISGMTEERELAKMSVALNGMVSYNEFWYMLCIFVLVYVLVFYLKKINISQANMISVASGCGIYIILSIIANLVFGTVSVSRLATIIIGAIVSALLAAAAVYAILPLDYARLETFEFEDNEYHYYVRAVPKAVIRQESVRVKKISSRKEVNPEKRREKQQ